MSEEESITLEDRYGANGFEVVGRWDVPDAEDPTGHTIVLVVHHTAPTWGHAVWVGNLDGIERIASANTEWSARWVASNYAPEAKPKAA
jgi:hypothetical protein